MIAGAGDQKQSAATASSSSSSSSAPVADAGGLCQAVVTPGISAHYTLQPQPVVFETEWRELKIIIDKIFRLDPVDRQEWNHKFGDVYAICIAMPETMADDLYKRLEKAVQDTVLDICRRLPEEPTVQLLTAYDEEWRKYHTGAEYVHILFRYLNRVFATRERHMYPGFEMFATGTPNAPGPKEIGAMVMACWRTGLVDKHVDSLRRLLLQAINDQRADPRGTTEQFLRQVAAVVKSFVQMEEFDYVQTGPNGQMRVGAASIDPNQDIPERRQYYEQCLEQPILADAREYYQKMAESLLCDSSVSVYLNEVLLLLDRERDIARRLLHSATLEKVTSLVRDTLVAGKAQRLNAAVEGFTAAESRSDLQNLYHLSRPLADEAAARATNEPLLSPQPPAPSSASAAISSSAPGPAAEPTTIAIMVAAFEKHVLNTGLAAVADLGSPEQAPNNFIAKILEIHAKYTKMVTEVFDGDAEFTGAMDRAIQQVVNKRESGPAGRMVSRAPERLSKYTDALLRKSQRGLDEAEMEQRLAQMIVIFRYVEDKDIFLKFYIKHLSHRLLNNVSQSKDAEETCIQKLKSACGYEYTSKPARMITDISVSEDVTRKFLEAQSAQNQSPVVPMSVMVLSTNTWPMSIQHTVISSQLVNEKREALDVQLPCELADGVRKFDDYYSASHSGRKLQWNWQHSTVEVKLSTGDRPYIAVMTVHQLMILDLFQTNDTLTLAEISNRVQIAPPDAIPRTVRSLVEAKLLLCKDNEMTDSSVLSVNLAFTATRLRIRVPMPTTKKEGETAAAAARNDADQVIQTAQADRKMLLECTVVRIMKSRKVVRHTALVQQVIEQTKNRFTPDVAMIKRVVEDLIDKLYLQRTQDQEEYQYMA